MRHISEPIAPPSVPPAGLWPEQVPDDVRAFLDQNPGLGSGDALDLAYDEFCRLAEAGAAPDPDAFCDRYPTIRASLRRAIEAHKYLQDNLGLLEERTPVAWPVEGETFLGFRLLRELGRGSFARVFLAAEPDLGDRLVAVKVSPHGGAEAQTLGRLDHPNVVKVYAVRHDERSGLTAVCMPYLGGATLEGVLAAKPTGKSGARAILDAARAGTGPAPSAGDGPAPHPLLQTGSYAEGVCLLAAQLADALAFLHRRSIYHRDLKPSNVLLCPDGRPMLLDFNLSADPQAARDRLGGTLPYMSPEQVLATFDPERATVPVDGRSDLFSLGVILFELLTGRLPFGEVPRGRPEPEDCAALLERQRQGAPSLRRLCPEATPGLARVVAACLAFDRHLRPRDAAEVTRALRRDLAPYHRLLRRLRHHPRKLAAAAAVVVAFATGAGAYEAAQPPPATRLMNDSDKDFAQGRPLEAVHDLNLAVAAQPDAGTRGAAARRMMREGFYAGAIVEFREADRLHPDPLFPACVAYCLARVGKNRDAVPEGERAVEAGFKTPEVYNNLAFSQMPTSRIAEARHNLARALDFRPPLPAACHNRLLLLRTEILGEETRARALAEARPALELALRTCPASAELYGHAANLCAAAALHAGRPEADDWGDRALAYLEQGAKQRLDLKAPLSSDLYIRLREGRAARWAALANARPVPADNVPTARLADPLPER